MRGIVTINTDAGFYPIEKIGSFAYWIKGDNLFLSGSGVFKNLCKNPTEAETKALINAVSVLIQSGYTDITKVIFNRDNIYAKSSKNGNELEKMLYEKLRVLRQKCKYTGSEPFYEYRHVRAHTNKKNARSWVNDWCDKECKRQLREYKRKMNENKSGKI